nr:PREDICTED: Schwann cell myelin protein-like isoform X2 [Lepisosteus oculatus]
MSPFLIYLFLQGFADLCDGWTVTLPKHMTGLRGSCMVIPCSFDYSSDPPKNFIVVWYQYAGHGYPLVFDERNPNNVIDKFRQRTRLVGNVDARNCSLKITDLNMSHHKEKIYPWVDPDYISWRVYAFYDTNVELRIQNDPPEPEITLEGPSKEGELMSVRCSTYHSCPDTPPSFSFTGLEGQVKISHTPAYEGVWRSTAVLTWTAKRTDEKVLCNVTHPGPRSASIQLSLNIEYAPAQVQWTQIPEAVREGGAVVLFCHSQGFPPASNFYWYRKHGQRASLLKGNSNELRITNVSREGGSYYCKAKNEVGETNSNVSPLNVQYTPEILPGSHCLFNEGKLRCVCLVDSNPPASITWYFNTSSNTAPFNKSRTENGNLVTEVLTGKLKSVVNITCSPSNILGKKSFQLTLTVSGDSTWKIVLGALGLTVVLLVFAIGLRRYRKTHSKKTPPQPMPPSIPVARNTRENTCPDGNDIYANTDWQDLQEAVYKNDWGQTSSIEDYGSDNIYGNC